MQHGRLKTAMIYVFGEYALDLARRELCHGDRLVAIEPKMFEVLRYLLEHRDRVVSKDELFTQCWPDTFVTEAALTRCLTKLRKVVHGGLGDTPAIKTMHRQGYRFVIPVETLTPDPHREAVTPPVPVPQLQTPNLPDLPAVASFVTGAPARVQDTSEVLAAPAVNVAALAERRQLTVLCCDLVEAAALAVELELEDFHDVVRIFHDCCQAVIAHFDGHLAHQFEHGVVVYFGYPQAYDDAVQRAIRAGLQLVETWRQSPVPGTLSIERSLAVRVGVHTGPVVVETGRPGASQQPLVGGATVTRAGRLRDLAAPHTVVISAATAQLAEGYFTWQALGSHTLTGQAQPLAVYQVLAEKVRQSRLDVAALRGLTPFVGREPELALLRDRWLQTREGLGQVVIINGEGGIGKSRLVHMLTEQLTTESHIRMECQCAPYYQHTALHPIIDLVQRLVYVDHDASPADHVKQLERFWQQYRLDLQDSLPLITALLNLSLPPERYPPLQLSPEQQRQRTLETLVTLLVALTEAQPVLLVMEDVHWMDPSSLEFLTLLIDQTSTVPLLMVLTCRPTFTPPWGLRSPIIPIALTRLARQHVAEMVTRVPGGQALSPEVIEHIVAKTDGVPLFIEEVTRLVVEAGGRLTPREQGKAGGALTAVSVPATLHDSLMARLDQVGEAKRTAQLGAVIGREFTAVLLRAVSPLDEVALEHDLDRLWAAELLYRRGTGAQATYIFKHALIQEAAYTSLLKKTRQQYHQRLVEVLEAHFPEIVDSQPALLARHALHSEAWGQALRYFWQAGTRAMKQSAYQEAVFCFEQALGTLQHLPQHRDTIEQAIDLRFNLRSALLPIWKHERVLAIMREAQALAEALGDAPRLGHATANLTHALWLAADLDQALTAGQRAVALTTPIKNTTLQLMAHFSLAEVYFSMGQFGEASEVFRRNVDILIGDSVHENSGPMLSAVVNRRWLAQSLAEMGLFIEGMLRGEDAIRIAEIIDQPYSLANAYTGAGYLYLCKGNLPKAIACYTRAVDVCERWHILQILHGPATGLSLALCLSGRVADALTLLERAVGQPPPLSLLVSRMPEIPRLSEVYLCAGRVEEALHYTEQILAFARAHHERGREAYALRLLGEIMARRDPHTLAHAASHYQQALALATELGMRPLQAHCHHGLGTLYRQMDRAGQARAALSMAIDLYRDMEMTFWLPEAEVALAGVKHRY
jgi:class 3 adenylate cyclase/DNA-binding winged helix-turn-helix (wHTH) protein/tetratricopeptide (TPR) repeat protein